MHGVDLIIFDLDGTLVDSRHDIANAVNHTLKNLGLKAKSTEEITSYVGKGVGELLKKSLGDKQGLLVQEALSIFTDYFNEHYADSTRLYPYVKETLEYFEDKKKAIITNRFHRLAELTLKAMEIRGYFDDIIGSDDENCMKPSACPLDKTMAKFDIRDKDKAIMVGDMDIDIMTGKNAGILTCAVTYGLGRREDIIKAKPDYIIDDMGKLKEIIE
jgi:phosphoglycolate phosphatase